MGCVSEKTNQDELIVSCLNYSGIQDSPYEFYDSENTMEKQINRVFAEVCSKYVQNFDDPKFKWQIGKIDKEWHTRFTPIYLLDCGIKQDGQLMTREQFEAKWEQLFIKQFPKYQGKVYGKVPKQEKQKMLLTEKQQCKLFDYCIYQTIVRYVYEINSLKDLKDDAKLYNKHQSLAFDKPYLNEELKLTKTINSIKINRVDVFFIQQGNENLVKEFEKNISDEFYILHKIHKNSTSMILVRKDRFPQIQDFRNQNDKFMQIYNKQCGRDAEVDFDWNNDTVFQAIGNTILISSHLSSKKQKNSIQIKQMKEFLERFRRLLPHYHFIMGGDLNGDLQYIFEIKDKDGKPEKINVFPDIGKDTTVYKKRTLIQAQKHKANQLSNAVKDYLVTSYPFVTSRIVTMNNMQVKKGKDMPLLPNMEHPYDHYLVAGKIKLYK